MKELESSQIITLILAQNINESRIDFLSKMGFVQKNTDGFEFILDMLKELDKDDLIELYNENTKNLKKILL